MVVKVFAPSVWNFYTRPAIQDQLCFLQSDLGGARMQIMRPSEFRQHCFLVDEDPAIPSFDHLWAFLFSDIAA